MSPREITSFFMAAGESAGLLLVVLSIVGFSCEKWLGWFTSCPVDFWATLAFGLSAGLLLAWLLWFVFHRRKT
jgi:hypothetical protein